MHQDQDYIEGFRSGDERLVNTLCTKVYQENQDSLIGLVQKNSGTREDGEDVFQRSILAIVEKSRTDKEFTLKAKMSTYIYRVCLNLWLNELRRRGKKPHLTNLDDSVLRMSSEDIEEIVELDKKNRQSILFHEKLNSLGDKCKSILNLYFQKKSGERIAEILKMKPGSVRTTIYNCKKTLTELIQSDNRFKELK